MKMVEKSSATLSVPSTKWVNCTECWFWRPSISCSSINKMGRLHRMLILKTCPYQQILSSKGAETTNGTASQHIHINKYADLPDGSTIQIVDSGPLFTFLVIPKQQNGTRILYDSLGVLDMPLPLTQYHTIQHYHAMCLINAIHF